ncbi:Fungal Zn(2)-Cys(6) binuclear cluster domain [Rhizoctonia solani]|uniref:Fungal Zn(2)-Cys(6) binuclear cluster domain n=1 Tax=Rhizoctonia solani TaxID=456999 RepID=A0A8H8T0J6_9AGAM|nr:Fungal Zn(2)-Cys(6) binuclear cluster domain [Rhizoctonia solani]QRW25466.1 Fungal Zn(2)-Cys(6) binuclear cluster domain [Rhizoctonia solani]
MDEDTSGRRRSGRPTAQPSTNGLRDLRDGPRACQNCRKLKLRCTNEKPHCSTCISKSITCEYDDSTRQSGRIAAAATTAAAAAAAAAAASTSRKRPASASTYAQVKESRQKKRAAAAATSCDFCRNDLRRKCDGLRPSCQSCIKRGVTCQYSGPALLSTTTSASPTTPLATQPSVVTVVSDNEPDSDVAMRSRSGSPDIPLAETAKEDPKIRYPQGNGLGNPGSSRNPDGSNCTRPVACFFCIQVELPCTGDYPTCVNCIRRNRVCAYPEPASYAHQFPRQSAMHARQLKNGPSSPGKSLSGSPGKRIPGTVDAVLSTARTGILGGGPVSIRDIVDPPHGGTRGGVLDAPPRAGVLDTPPRGTIETTNNTPRGTLDAPRNSLEPTHAPQPTLYTSRPLNRSQATPTPPSMSVSPNSSGGASIQVLGATPKTSDQNGTLPARSEKEPSEGWSGRSRTGSTSADMSRTLSDINLDQYRPPIQPQPQSQPQPHPNSQRASPISPIQAANRPQPAPPYNPGGRTQSPPKLTVQVTNSGSPRTAPRPVVSTGLSSRPGPSLGRYGDIPPRETYQDGRPNGSEFRSRARPPVNGRDRRDSFDKDRRESFSERDRERDRDRRDSLMSRRDSFDRDRDRDRERDRERWDSYDRDRDRDRERERERERRDSIRGPPPPSTWATARDPPPPRLDIRPLIVPPDPKVTSPVVYARPPSARSSPADMEMDSS